MRAKKSGPLFLFPALLLGVPCVQAGFFFYFFSGSKSPSSTSVPKTPSSRASTQEKKQLYETAVRLYRESASDKTASLETFRKFLKEQPDSSLVPDTLFTVGEIYFEQALEALRRERSPQRQSPWDSPEQLLALAQERKKAEEEGQAPRILFEKAREAYQKVAKIEASGLADSALYRIAEIHYNQKEWDLAIEHFLKLQQHWPKSYLVPDSLLSIAQTHLAQEQFTPAETQLTLLEQAYPAYAEDPQRLYAQALIDLRRGNHQKAEAGFSKLQTPEALYYLGKTQMVMGLPLQAVISFKKFLNQHPRHPLTEEVDFLTAEAYLMANDFDGAITHYRRFLDKYPASSLKVAAHFRIGSSYFRKERYLDARGGFAYILTHFDQDSFAPLAQYLTGESYLNPQKYREAIFAYGDLTKKYPADSIAPNGIYKLAWSHLQLQNYPQAEQTCQSFLSLYPNHPLAKNIYLILGNSLHHQNRHEAAAEAYQKILDIAPGTEIAELAFLLIYRAQYTVQNYDSMITAYHYLLNRFPPTDSPFRGLSYLYGAEAYLRKGLFEQGRSVYELILRTYPAGEAALHARDGLAWSYFLTGEDERAAQEREKLKSMIRSAKKPPPSLEKLNAYETANTLFNRKQYEQALPLYEKFLKENPDLAQAPQAQFRAALSLYHLRYYTDAIEAWKKLVQSYPHAAQAEEAAYKIADTYFRAQKYDAAISEYQKIPETYPRSQELSLASLRILQAHYNAGKDGQAVDQAQALFQKFSQDPRAMEALDLLEAVFDRNPKLDPGQVLGTVVQAYPSSSLAASAQFRLAKILFGQKKYKESIQAFQKFSENYADHPQLPQAQFQMAEAYFESKLYEEAVPVYERFLANFPNAEEVPVALFHLANTYYTLKQYDLAASNYETLAKKYPDSPFVKAAAFNQALSYKAMGNLDLAQLAYQEYIANYPKEENAQALLWEVFQIQKEKGQYGEAAKTLQKLEAETLKDPQARLEILYRYAEVALAQGEPARALQHYEELRSLKPAANPFRLQALVHLAEAYEQEKRWKEAIAVYEDLGRNATNPQISKTALERAKALQSASHPTPPKTPAAKQTTEDLGSP